LNLNVSCYSSLLMPEKAATRAYAAAVARRMCLVPWHENRSAVMPVVYRELGLGPYTKKKPKPAPKVPALPECCVCMEEPAIGALDPCGHRLCNACATRVRACPTCRAHIRSYVKKVY